ncbi:MAG: hypothetical protein SRB2_03896 [Desulfobacteraceae bacterium Eth-SRB2]|nr:MAG: hypothetical protein SRB2_03896 [Desulfobacteraceae bacterium Eth-SRB2]
MPFVAHFRFRQRRRPFGKILQDFTVSKLLIKRRSKWIDRNKSGRQKARITADLSSKFDLRPMLSKREQDRRAGRKGCHRSATSRKGKVFPDTFASKSVDTGRRWKLNLKTKQLLPLLFFSVTTAHMVLRMDTLS